MGKYNIHSKKYKASQQRKREKYASLEVSRNAEMNSRMMDLVGPAKDITQRSVRNEIAAQGGSKSDAVMDTIKMLEQGKSWKNIYKAIDEKRDAKHVAGEVKAIEEDVRLDKKSQALLKKAVQTPRDVKGARAMPLKKPSLKKKNLKSRKRSGSCKELPAL